MCLAQKKLSDLSRRERQIMDVVFRLQEVSVSDILESLTDPPSYSAVRALVGILQDKGYLRHRKEGRKYVYSATVQRERASKSALKHVMKTFFDNSAEQLVAALVDPSQSDLSDHDLERLSRLIEQARKEGK
ncbi:MAG TPA: BlaI/MecI/CopY family transcriptional regulator [candidate division Zixibacteria bacterium]|nr:BlaI/MecI/CopY family transcriptional regulator [candidate division Zixibacteria bacterium]